MTLWVEIALLRQLWTHDCSNYLVRERELGRQLRKSLADKGHIVASRLGLRMCYIWDLLESVALQ